MLSFNSSRIQSGFNIFRIVSRVKMHKKYFRIVIVQFQHYTNEKSLTIKCELINCEKMGSYTNIAYGHMTSDLLKLLFSAIGCQQHLRFLLRKVFYRENSSKWHRESLKFQLLQNQKCRLSGLI